METNKISCKDSYFLQIKLKKKKKCVNYLNLVSVVHLHFPGKTVASISLFDFLVLNPILMKYMHLLFLFFFPFFVVAVTENFVGFPK